MRKFVTVLMMIAMLSMPNNMAWAVKSGSGSGSGENKGGYDANVSLQQALARPAFFVTIALTQIIVMTTLFAPRVVIGRPKDTVLLTLAMTGTLTLAYFLFVMKEFYRYIIYQVLFALPYFHQYDTNNRVSSQEAETEDDIWRVNGTPEVVTTIRKKDNSTPRIVSEEQLAIEKAVEKALRDPELAETYLEYASPNVRRAVRKALDNLYAVENGERFTIEERWEGDNDALLSELMERK